MNKSNNLRGYNVKYLSYVLTEQGIMMLSGFLKSDIAVKVNIQIIDAFVKMRRYFANSISNNMLLKQLKYIIKGKKSDIMDRKGDEYMNDPIIIQTAANLAEIAARNGASIIFDKIKKAKANKDTQKTINELEEIINDLITDKNQIQMIAQSYEQELISQKITEDDIKYITKNILPIFKEFIPDKIQIEQLEKILSVETLTIMQLIGFNYKQAIGEPLTLLARKSIESKIPMDSKVNIEYVLAMANLAKDAESTKRYFQLTGQNVSVDDAN